MSQSLSSRDPLSWIKVCHLADQVLEVGIEHVAPPEGERPTWVLLGEGLGDAAKVRSPGVAAAEVLKEIIYVFFLGEVRNLSF